MLPNVNNERRFVNCISFCYNDKTWTVLKENLQIVGDFERRMLRKMFDGASCILNRTKARRIRWAGHVEQMPEHNMICVCY